MTAHCAHSILITGKGPGLRRPRSEERLRIRGHTTQRNTGHNRGAKCGQQRMKMWPET